MISRSLLAVVSSIVFSIHSYALDASWLPEIASEDEFTQISVKDTSRQDLLRTTKFLAPAKNDPTLLQTVYQNVNLYLLHLEFMVNVFPERFGGLTAQEYMDMVLLPVSRQYFAGAIYQFKSRQGEILYGFSIYSSPSAPPQADEILRVYSLLSQTMKLRPFAYAPMTPADIESAKRWQTPGFPIYLPTGLIEPEFEAYSPNTNYGRVRLFTLEDLNKAVQEGSISWQDIVVVDTAPTDVETVVAGIVTGTRQGELSHVNVRSLRRGTPNAYIQNPLQVFKPVEGQLIRLDVTGDGYEIAYPVELADAEAWWAEHRPKIPAIKEPDDNFTDLVSLPDMQKLDIFDSLTQRFGGKASQLGILYSVMGNYYGNPEEDMPFLVDGFAIPFHYYREFMQTNTIPHPLDSNSLVSYEEFIQILMQNERFRSDTVYRHERLEYFMEYMRDKGTVNPDWVAKIAAKIIEVYGSATVKVKFRSSSNAEDDIAFNGAGLYDSTAACAQDTLDSDDQGPCQCDPDETKERTIERALIKVWASLWKPMAYEERDYYQIDHTRARMGILVSRAYPHEDSNGVAFTGDPISGRKDLYIINVQQGDESVVQPGTGIIPEKDILNIKYEMVESIQRARQSSLTPEGQWVLTDDQLREVALYLTVINDRMPAELRGYTRDQIYFDVEFKYDNGQFVIKQVRPTLMASADRPPVNPEKVTLHIPEKTQLATYFNMQRTIRQEYDTHSEITFKTGNIALPVHSGTYEIELIDRFEYSPAKILAQPVKPGVLTVQALYESGVQNAGGVILQYDYQQSFLINQKTFELTIQGLEVIGENKANYQIELNNETIINQLNAFGLFEGGEFEDTIYFKVPSDYQGQIRHHDLRLENGQRVQLYEVIRFRMLGTGFVYANLVLADVSLTQGSAQLQDYWNLVYTAQGHCWNAKFWALFDQPIGDAYGVAVLTTTLQWGAVTEAEVYLLDKYFEHLRKLEVVSYTKEEVEKLPDPNTGVGNWAVY